MHLALEVGGPFTPQKRCGESRLASAPKRAGSPPIPVRTCVSAGPIGGCACLGVEGRAGHAVWTPELSQPGVLHPTVVCAILPRRGPCRPIFSRRGHGSSWCLCPGWVRVRGRPGWGCGKGAARAGPQLHPSWCQNPKMSHRGACTPFRDTTGPARPPAACTLAPSPA